MSVFCRVNITKISLQVPGNAVVMVQLCHTRDNCSFLACFSAGAPAAFDLSGSEQYVGRLPCQGGLRHRGMVMVLAVGVIGMFLVSGKYSVDSPEGCTQTFLDCTSTCTHQVPCTCIVLCRTISAFTYSPWGTRPTQRRWQLCWTRRIGISGPALSTVPMLSAASLAVAAQVAAQGSRTSW